VLPVTQIADRLVEVIARQRRRMWPRHSVQTLRR
jgi:hypothetical protein